MTGKSLAGSQIWTAKSYEKNARFVSDLGSGVLEWLGPCEGKRILDLGCGDGALSERIKQAGAELVGIDTSENLLEAARKRGLDVHCMNAQALEFDSEFDAVFSNAAMHWMRDQDAVAAGVAKALKPGGRFVGEFGGHGNVAAIITALTAVAKARGVNDDLSHPWVYPTVEEHTRTLNRHGFAIEKIKLIPRPTPLPTGMTGWLETFRKPFFGQFPQNEREEVIAEISGLLEWSLRDKKGNWTADYVRIRFAAALD